MLATAPPPPPCVPAAAHVVLARGPSAVFTTTSNYAACTGTHRPVILGTRLFNPGFNQVVSTFRLTGRLVAFVVNSAGPAGSPASVEARDLTNGAVLAHHRAVLGGSPPRSSDDVSSFVARADGRLAWIVVTHPPNTTATRRQVDTARPSSHVRRLDRGAGIGARSLSLHGRTLRWRHGGKARHARI